MSKPQTERSAKDLRKDAMIWLVYVNAVGELSPEDESRLVKLREEKGFRRAQRVASRKYAKRRRKEAARVAAGEEQS